MLKESLKWMFLTLLVAALLTGGVIAAVRLTGEARPQVQPQSTAVPEEQSAATAAPTALPTPTPTPTPIPTPTHTPLPESADELLRVFISDMTTEEKLGQMVLFGFSGTGTPNSTFTALME